MSEIIWSLELNAKIETSRVYGVVLSRLCQKGSVSEMC